MTNPSDKRRLCVLLHCKATQDEALREAIETIRARGYPVDVRVGWEGGDLGRYALEMIDTADVLVSGGGDGTLNEVANALYSAGRLSDAVLSVLPVGTANDFACGSGLLSNDPLEALTIAAEAEPILIDLGRLGDRVFVNTATGGYGAEVTVKAPEGIKKVLGGFAYFLTGLVGLPAIQGRPTQVAGPDFAWKGDLLGFGVGNGRQAGGGVCFAPEALLNDGLLDVALFPGANMSDVGGLVAEVMNNQPLGDGENVITARVPWLTVKVSEPMHLNLDGEPMAHETFRFDVLPRALAFCLPPDAPLV